jgi:very-short-patch-repair endonuclease
MTDYRRHPDPKRQLAKATNASNKDKLEGAFLAAWCQQYADLPEPEREYRFHPTRKWPFDFAWPAIKLAVEIQGGGQRGRHASITGMTNDCDKFNAAISLGWRVLKFTAKHKPEAIAEAVAKVLCGLELDV